MAFIPDTYELVTDPDTGAPAIKVSLANGFHSFVIARTAIDSMYLTELINPDLDTFGHTRVSLEVGQVSRWFTVANAEVNAIIAYLFGISEHFYTAIRIIDVPDGRNQYAFISTNRDTRVVGKDEVAGWEFKETTKDGIHNLCITLKTGHTVLIVLGLLEYKAWESSHLGRFSYRYINYDGTVTDNPVFPPEPPTDDGDGSTT